MSKINTSVRIESETLRKLEEHNMLRCRCGLKPVTLGAILAGAVELWIDSDRHRIRNDAQRVLDELGE